MGFDRINPIGNEPLTARRSVATDSRRPHATQDVRPPVDTKTAANFSTATSTNYQASVGLFGPNLTSVAQPRQQGARSIDDTFVSLPPSEYKPIEFVSTTTVPTNSNPTAASRSSTTSTSGFTRAQLTQLSGNGRFSRPSSSSVPTDTNMMKTFVSGAWEGAKNSAVVNYAKDIKTGFDTGNWSQAGGKTAILGALYLGSKWKVTAPFVAAASILATTAALAKTGYHGVKAVQAVSIGDQQELRKHSEGIGSGGTDALTSLWIGKKLTKGDGMIRKPSNPSFGATVKIGSKVDDITDAGMFKTYGSQLWYMARHPGQFFGNAWRYRNPDPAGPQRVQITNMPGINLIAAPG